MTEEGRLVANPLVVLREEFDDWAVLFDPDSRKAFGVNPVGVFIWKHLDGQMTRQDILQDLNKNCDEVPEEAEEQVRLFIQGLVEEGLVGYEL
jgi:SynChlorMet cassette protein ScmD